MHSYGDPGRTIGQRSRYTCAIVVDDNFHNQGIGTKFEDLRPSRTRCNMMYNWALIATRPLPPGWKVLADLH